MDYRQMTAPCGLDCFNCALYLANTDEKLREAAAARLNVPVERAVCQGCRTEGGTITPVGMSGPCHVFRCSGAKGVDFCCDCGEFPCDHLHPYADQAGQKPHNTKVFNLCLIKRMGLEEWAREKAGQVKRDYFKGKLKLSD